MYEAPVCACGGIFSQGLGRRRPAYELLDVGNLDEVPSSLRQVALACFTVEPAPWPLRRSFPLVADGVAARPSGIECHFDLCDVAIATAFSRLELALRGAHASEVVESFCAAPMKALLGSLAGMFRGPWRPSIRWFGPVCRSAVAVLSTGNIPARAGWPQASDLDDAPGQLLQDLAGLRKFGGSLEFRQWRTSS